MDSTTIRKDAAGSAWVPKVLFSLQGVGTEVGQEAAGVYYRAPRIREGSRRARERETQTIRDGASLRLRVLEKVELKGREGKIEGEEVATSLRGSQNRKLRNRSVGYGDPRKVWL